MTCADWNSYCGLVCQLRRMTPVNDCPSHDNEAMCGDKKPTFTRNLRSNSPPRRSRACDSPNLQGVRGVFRKWSYGANSFQASSISRTKNLESPNAQRMLRMKANKTVVMLKKAQAKDAHGKRKNNIVFVDTPARSGQVRVTNANGISATGISLCICILPPT